MGKGEGVIRSVTLLTFPPYPSPFFKAAARSRSASLAQARSKR